MSTLKVKEILYGNKIIVSKPRSNYVVHVSAKSAYAYASVPQLDNLTGKCGVAVANLTAITEL